MKRVRTIEHNAQQILVLDLSGIENTDDALAPIAEMRELVTSAPEGSVLTLTDVAGAPIDEKLAAALWELLKANKKHVRAGAVVGVTSDMQRDLFDLVTHQARRDLELFDDVEVAKDWLVEQ
jgi:hypothetical protein